MKKLKVLFLFAAISLATLYSCTDGDSIENEVVTEKSFSLRSVLNELKKSNNISGRSINDTIVVDSTALCFEFVYPLDLAYNNGTTVSVSSFDGIIDLLSNETPSLYIEGIAFPFQVTLATADSATPITISNEADFEELISSCGMETFDNYVTSGMCYEYTYPLSYINQNGTTITVNNESELFDSIINDENIIVELAFPFNVIYNGESVEINNLYELFEMDNNCVSSFCTCSDEYAPVCVATPTGETMQFPNACIAECAGYTPADYVDCGSSSVSGFDGLGTCFTVQYPIQVQYQGAVYSVSSDSELLDYLNSPTGAVVNYPIVIHHATSSMMFTIESQEGLNAVVSDLCN
ncbi:hypothetical protein [Flavobacterium sp.]|uniref:hypothetical protein n=1 Tax=Flavobacterium sp. TaxID=239 RepID=UPI00260F8498|nr:hypothetical protein [Flavobacterium sp.]